MIRNQFESLQRNIRETTMDIPLEAIAFATGREILRDQELPGEMKKKLVDMVRAWGAYVQNHDLGTNNLFEIRWHIAKFAEQYFHSAEGEQTEVLSTPIDDLSLPGGEQFPHYIEDCTGKGILNDSDVALIGGASRLALKLFSLRTRGVSKAEQRALIRSELPLSDVDIVINKSRADGTALYGAQLAGTHMSGDINKEIKKLLSNVDCTINQSLIWNHTLYYTPAALDDIASGTVRFTDKEDALFGREAFFLPDGKQYINRTGLYRAFSYLVRGKAERFPIYRENLEREVSKEKQWTWVVLLVAKILPMADMPSKTRAINHWFNLAKCLHATNQSRPLDFLRELIKRDRNVVNAIKRQKTGDTQVLFDAEIRWLTRKLIFKAIEQVASLADPQPLSGMSDDMVVIDQSYFSKPQRNLANFFKYLQRVVSQEG